MIVHIGASPVPSFKLKRPWNSSSELRHGLDEDSEAGVSYTHSGVDVCVQMDPGCLEMTSLVHVVHQRSGVLLFT